MGRSGGAFIIVFFKRTERCLFSCDELCMHRDDERMQVKFVVVPSFLNATTFFS